MISLWCWLILQSIFNHVIRSDCCLSTTHIMQCKLGDSVSEEICGLELLRPYMAPVAPFLDSLLITFLLVWAHWLEWIQLGSHLPGTSPNYSMKYKFGTFCIQSKFHIYWGDGSKNISSLSRCAPLYQVCLSIVLIVYDVYHIKQSVTVSVVLRECSVLKHPMNSMINLDKWNIPKHSL